MSTTIQRSDDPVKRNLELTCDQCGERLCDVEDGDTLETLTGVERDHEPVCGGEADDDEGEGVPLDFTVGFPGGLP